ncbi:MAG: NUDIX domain-containing protein [Aeromicrobium erythreum]
MVDEAHRTQRLGAYAVVVRPDPAGREHLLLTRVSAVGYPPGWWALPGGGVDHGESPGRTVLRELWEEAGLRAASTWLVDVHDVHVVEQGRADRYEDYHGVHLLYRVELEREPGGGPLPTPRVTEVGGTTDVARWVPLHEIDDSMRLLPAVEHALERLDDYRSVPLRTTSG